MNGKQKEMGLTKQNDGPAIGLDWIGFSLSALLFMFVLLIASRFLNHELGRHLGQEFPEPREDSRFKIQLSK